MTHAERLHAVLSDGRWHSLADLHARAGHMIVHSRIADLRAKGHRIEHRTVGVGATGSEYRLVPLGAGEPRADLVAACSDEAASVDCRASSSPVSSGPSLASRLDPGDGASGAVPRPLTARSEVLIHEGQLTLTEAA